MKRIASILLIILASSIASAQTQTRQQLIDEIAVKRAELVKLEKLFLAPSEEDRASFARLLSQPQTGLIRLLPREDFDIDVNKKNTKTITARGGGAYYSFVRLTHEYGYGSDISLDQGKLSVGFAGCDYGMLASLGDIPLEELSLGNPVVATLARYTAPTFEPDVRVEQRRFMTGTTLDALSLSSRVPAELNTTYVLRSISYDRSDIIVGLRVARKDSDGSLIIAWKLLEKFPAPQLARNNQPN